MTPIEHLQSLADFFDRCGRRAHRQFKREGRTYDDGQSDAFHACAVHLRALAAELSEGNDDAAP